MTTFNQTFQGDLINVIAQYYSNAVAASAVTIDLPAPTLGNLWSVQSIVGQNDVAGTLVVQSPSGTEIGRYILNGSTFNSLSEITPLVFATGGVLTPSGICGQSGMDMKFILTATTTASLQIRATQIAARSYVGFSNTQTNPEDV